MAEPFRKPEIKRSAWRVLPPVSAGQLGENCGPECDLHGAEPLLEIRNLSVIYGRNVALRDVNLALPRAQLTGLIGPNGAGKSTLLKAILGMVPFSGQVETGGQPAMRNRQTLAYVPQKEDVRWDFPVTVADVVMMGRYRHIGWLRRPSHHDHKIVDEALARVHMSEFKKRQISQLSGGQQQRVFVARALAQQGDIILLDEPLTGIDATSQDVIMSLLLELRDSGKLILMATHDLPAAAEICDATALINKGLVAYGPSDTVFRPNLLAATFGSRILTLGGGNGSTTFIVD